MRRRGRLGCGWERSRAIRESGPGSRQFVDYACVWEAIPDDGLQRFGERSA